MDNVEDVPMGKMALAKAQELFKACDKEDKGFIIKRDMQRLAAELPGLSPDQLEEVFDSLDQDKNGFLTMEEFVQGFGAFLGLQIEDEEANKEEADDKNETKEEEERAVDEEQFNVLMERIGASDVLADHDVTKKLWSKLRNDEPELLSNFEDFLHGVSSQMKQTQDEVSNLENVLENRTSSHDEEIKKLYEEMENELRMEKERIAAEEQAKLQKIRDEMMKELTDKDHQLQEFVAKHHDMEKRMEQINSGRTLTEMEKTKLEKEREEYQTAKDRMENELESTRKILDEHRQQLEVVKKQTREERRERAKAAFKVTEGIATEREDLVKQLEFLRQVNKKLQDERDEMKHMQEDVGPNFLEMAKRDSIIGNYLNNDKNNEDGGVPKRISHPLQTIQDQYETDECEVDDDLVPGHIVNHPVHQQYQTQNYLLNELNTPAHAGESMPLRAPFLGNTGTNGSSSLADELAPFKQARNSLGASNGHQASVNRNVFVAGPPNSLANELGQALASETQGTNGRVEPLGGNEQHEAFNRHSRKDSSYTPERIFKVVFVGDSGVGKTCFLHRFCHNRFRSTFSATIGVDFQVKSLNVDDRIVALQLWDTAGQERFRSITKQYFRKADGVLLMYDVTSELSFLNLRNWMQSVKEGVDPDCVLCLVGNKLDLCDNNEDFRVVKHKMGEKLADEFNALFFETSAQTGEGIRECMSAMSVLLRDREDQHLEKALKLDMEVQKKRKCCGK